MGIDSIGPVDPVHKFDKPEKTSRPQKRAETDSVSLSDEAKFKAELYKATEEVRNSPDVRLDRIAEVKKRLEDPNYIDEKVLGDVAERLMDQFGIS